MNHYVGNKPSVNKLMKEGFIVMDGYVFCSEQCRDDWERELKAMGSGADGGRVLHP